MEKQRRIHNREGTKLGKVLRIEDCPLRHAARFPRSAQAVQLWASEEALLAACSIYIVQGATGNTRENTRGIVSAWVYIDMSLEDDGGVGVGLLWTMLSGDRARNSEKR